jgi:uncharacterized protein (TIGR02996 family)
MTEEDALFRAVCESPDDDGPRLILADWLEEHGQPERAEFIRLQCRTARRYLSWVYAYGNKESERERALNDQYGKRWLKGVPAPRGVYWHLWRGMPGHVWVQGWQELRRYGPRLFQVAPVEYVTFERLTLPGAHRLAMWPFLARLRLLGLLWAVRTVRTLEALLRSPDLRNLQTLDVQQCGLGDAVAFALARCPHLKRLKLLSLHSNRITDEGALALARSPNLAHVEQVGLCHNRISRAAVAELEKTFPHVSI